MIHDKNHTRPSTHKVTFTSPLPVYKGKAYASSLRLCNTHVDRYPKHIVGAIDSAAIDHFMPATYIGDNHHPTKHGIRVGCANGSEMQATATDILSLPQLPIAARGCHKFNEISLPLISVPKLCQAGCQVNFGTNKVDITTSNETHLMTGTNPWPPRTIPWVVTVKRTTCG